MSMEVLIVRQHSAGCAQSYCRLTDAICSDRLAALADPRYPKLQDLQDAECIHNHSSSVMRSVQGHQADDFSCIGSQVLEGVKVEELCSDQHRCSVDLTM